METCSAGSQTGSEIGLCALCRCQCIAGHSVDCDAVTVPGLQLVLVLVLGVPGRLLEQEEGVHAPHLLLGTGLLQRGQAGGLVLPRVEPAITTHQQYA